VKPELDYAGRCKLAEIEADIATSSGKAGGQLWIAVEKGGTKWVANFVAA